MKAWSLKPRSLKSWFKQQMTNERRYLGMFVLGAFLFFLGGGAMLFADNRMFPSLLQEIVALVGLCVCALGALCAASGYIMLTFIRLFRAIANND